MAQALDVVKDDAINRRLRVRAEHASELRNKVVFVLRQYLDGVKIMEDSPGYKILIDMFKSQTLSLLLNANMNGYHTEKN